MKRKQKFVLLITLVLILSLALPTLADSIVTATEGTGDTTVTKTVDTTFSVTIPATATFGTDGCTISVDNTSGNFLIDSNKKLVVKVSSTDYVTDSDKWLLKNGTSDSVEYKITKADASEVTPTTEIISVTAANIATANSAALSFAYASGAAPKYSGDYTDTLTFTVTLV